MSDRMALRVAIDLLHVPSQVRLVRSEPLPRGVPTLLRIAAGDDAAEREAADLTVRSRDVVRQAATFFIEQILFAPDADSYRVLGSAPQASAGELRSNVALLLQWLHPDRDPQRRALDFRRPGDGGLEQSQDAGAARRLRRAAPLLERKEIPQQGGAARQQKEIHRRAAPAAGARARRVIDV